MPTSREGHIDVPLTRMSVAYIQSEGAGFADKFAPNVPVNKQSGKFLKYDKGDFFRDDARPRAPGAEAAVIDFGTTWADYSCSRYSVAYDQADEVRDNYTEPLDADKAGSAIVTQKMIIKRDRAFAASMLTTGVWGSDQTGVSGSPSTNEFKQFDLSGSAPRLVLTQQIRAIQKRTGKKPNKLLVGPEVYDVLIQHADFTSVIQYSQGGVVTADILASILGLKEVIVAETVYNAAARGQTTDMAFAAGKVMLLGYVDPNPGLETVTAAATFSWSKYDLVKPGAAGIKRIRIEPREVDRLEGSAYFEHNAVAADAATYFASAVS